MGAYGVDPAGVDVAELAGMELARRSRQGYAQPGGQTNVNEMNNVRAPLWSAMDQYAYTQKPATPDDIGIPTGNNAQDYADAIAQTNRTTAGQRARLARQQPGRLAELHPDMAAQFETNQQTFQAARDLNAGDRDRFYSEQAQSLDQGGVVGGLGGTRGEPIDVSSTEDRSRNWLPEGVDMAQVRSVADTLPMMDATLRHIRRGGETVDGVPIPSGNIPADGLRDVLLGPDRNQINDTLQAEADRLGQIEARNPNQENRLAGIQQALDLIAGDRQSVGPDVAVAGLDLNLGDVRDTASMVARGTVRTASQAMDSLWQYGQASFRGIVNDPWSIVNPVAPSRFDTGRAVKETDLGIALENLAAGRALQQGGGYFVNPHSPDAQLRRRRELEHGNIGGHVITMGRWTADQVPGVEPDTTAFNVLSGLVDLGWQIVDPGGAFVDAAFRAPGSRRLLAEAGGFTSTRSVHPERFGEFLESRHGSATRNFYADLDPTDDLAIMASRPKKMPEWAHWTLARGEVGDTAYVDDTLANITGMGYNAPATPMRTHLAPVVAWRQRFNQSRLATVVPETGARAADIYDADALVETARASMRNARVPEDEIARIVGRIYDEGYEMPTRVRVQQLERELMRLDPATQADEIAEVQATIQELGPGLFINQPMPRRNVLHDIWFDDMQEAKRQSLIGAGVRGRTAEEIAAKAPEQLADRLVGLHEVGRRIDTAMADDLLQDGFYNVRRIGDQNVNARIWGTVNGEGVNDLSPNPFVHMAAEHQMRYLPLEDDYRQLARLTQPPLLKWINTLPYVGVAQKSGQPNGYAAVLDGFMNRVWKPSRLLRLAWPLRVVGEEQFRIAATGFDSAINHPLSYIALVMGTREDGALARYIDNLETGVEISTGGRVAATELGAMSRDLTGTPWGVVSEFREVQNRGARNWLIPGGEQAGGRFTGHHYQNVTGTLTPGYGEAWVDQFAAMHSDDLVRRIARIHLGQDSEFQTVDELIEAGGGAVGSADDLRLGLAGGQANPRGVEATSADVFDTVAPGGAASLPNSLPTGPGVPGAVGDAVTPREVENVYRWVSEDDWTRIQEQGFLDTSGVRDARRSGDTTRLYASVGVSHQAVTGRNRLLRIRVDAEDGWVVDAAANGQIEDVATSARVPLDRVEAVSPSYDVTLRDKRLLPEDGGGRPGQNIIARTRADLMDSGPDHAILGNRGRTGYTARMGTPEAGANSWDDYIESLEERLHYTTGGNDDLIDAVATGHLHPEGGSPISLDRPGTAQINPHASKYLQENYSDIAPRVIKGDRVHVDRAEGNIKRSSALSTEGYDRVMERMYSALGAAPTDRLSRSPAFRQYYYRRVQELLPFANAEAQRQIIKAADLAQLPDDAFHLRLSAHIDSTDSTVSPTLKTLESAAGRGVGDLTLEDVDEFAKLAALDNTRWLLYDVHKRGQFMDAMRIIFPFGEAWKEVFTRWMALTAERPGTVVSRASQLMRAAGHVQDWDAVVDDPSQHGFLFENSTGETVFTYPGAEWFTSAMTGVPVELTGSLNGLTLMNSVLPGVGPVVQIPASFSPALRDDPKYDEIRDLIFPFGMATSPEEEAGGAGHLISETLFSPAIRRVFQGIAAGGVNELGEQAGLGALTSHMGVVENLAAVFAGGDPEWDRLFMNSVFDTMRYNVSTGEYHTTATEGRSAQSNVNRTIEDSIQQAGALTLIRGLAGFSLPSAPIPEFNVTDQDGNLMMLRAMTDIYRNLQNEDYRTAPQVFLDRYGENLSLLLQAKSVPRSTLLPSTAEADRFLRSHPDFQTNYPQTYGLWLPGNEGEDAEFDFNAYNRAIRDADTLGAGLDPEDLVRLANNRAGTIEYNRERQRLVDTPGYTTEAGNLTEQAERYLATQVAPVLREKYLGFGADDLHFGVSTDDLREQGMEEARRAADDRLLPTELRGAISSYLGEHDRAMESAQDPNGYDLTGGYYTAVSAQPLRDYLRFRVAPTIRGELPERLRGRWDVIWDRLFDRVMLQPGEEGEGSPSSPPSSPSLESSGGGGGGSNPLAATGSYN
jgi:hypothetical protein